MKIVIGGPNVIDKVVEIPDYRRVKIDIYPDEEEGPEAKDA